MAGSSNFPTGLDDNTSLVEATDGVTPLTAAGHNNIKEAVKALEGKVGVYNTSVPTSLDYRLGHPTLGHNHGASGHGARISASSIVGFTALFDEAALHFVQMSVGGTFVVGSNVSAPVVIGRTMQLLSIQAGLRRGPSGATAAFDVMFGPTSVYGASQGYRPAFAPGATAYRSVAAATPNCITYPSGAVITVDTDAIGSSHAGNDAGITLVFRG